MPAPQYEIGKDVVARDGTRARVVGIFDFGEDAPAEYNIQTESGEIREHVAEDFIAEAPKAGRSPKVVPVTTPTPDAGAAPGAESAPVQTSDQPSAA